MNEWESYKVSDLPYQENNAFKILMYLEKEKKKVYTYKTKQMKNRNYLCQGKTLFYKKIKIIAIQCWIDNKT